MVRHFLLASICIILLHQHSFAQSDTVKPSALGIAAASLVPAAAITISVGQNYYDFWKNERKVPFHVSNDPPYSLHNDKLGHAMYSYICANVARLCYIESGVDRKTSAWIGFGTSLFAQTLVELGDGVHGNADYFGFSPGDEIADVFGAFIPVAKEYVPYLNRFDFKFGLWPSQAYDQGAFRGLLDDNESQFFWLTMDIHDYAGQWYPPWLNVAVGYGVENLHASAFLPDREGLTPKSLAYIGFDLNFKKLPIKGKVWEIIAEILSHYHVPFPALQVAPIVKWHWLKP